MPGKSKIPIWLPYTSDISWQKDKATFKFKGGVLDIPWSRISSILFYGAVCPLDEEFLQLCIRYNIPICIHRRHMSKAIWITGTTTTNIDDILTKQIIFRENKIKSLHIARKLLLAKVKSMEWLLPNNKHTIHKIKFAKSVKDLRSIEALHAVRYWKKYYAKLGNKESERRNRKNVISSVLNAVSKLISGVILRYITYHKMSPYHGFMHIPTDYPSLVYDLMEPYRGYIEKNIFETIKGVHKTNRDNKNLVAFATKGVEDLLDKKVYTHQTRQIVTFQELLHGNILALRAYLLGDAKKFIVPIPGRPLGGRPKKVGYKLYGRSAGPTDFNIEAERVSKDWVINTDRDK
ncbi:MAG: CRISPR-associated endonuclease Cas1 [Candidatus Campbellbacteria bacterium]|nr:CRISPR-associated endonuclease Cas1 [Candidatus Campbellbacteria bacterium]